MTNRRYLTARVKREIWEAQSGLCAACQKPKALGELEWDHARPLWGGGTNGRENFQGICGPCHKAKCAAEATSRAKADRCRAFMETGRGRARKGRPLKGGAPLQSRPFPKQSRPMRGRAAK